jgi:hypothetical protein
VDEAMPLRILHDRGVDRPAGICDLCGAEISDARDGNYQWQVDGQGGWRDGEIYFTHKRCCEAFEERHGGCSVCYAMEVDCLPICLGRNLRLKWREASSRPSHFSKW